jgi:hypothetical protein
MITEAMKICFALDLTYYPELENLPDPIIENQYNSYVFYGNMNYGSTDMHKEFMRDWHMTSRPPEWIEKVSKSVKQSYEKDPVLRNKRSERVTQTWTENYDKMKSIAKENLPEPMFGKDNPIALELEYKGKIYYGWRELKEATGVTKHLYHRYYVNGFDPEIRIGANGPLLKKKENQ